MDAKCPISSLPPYPTLSMRKSTCSLPSYPHSHWQVHHHSLIAIKAYVGILVCKEDQWRHSALCTKIPLDAWTFSLETASVGIVKPQTVSHSNKSHICVYFLILQKIITNKLNLGINLVRDKNEHRKETVKRNTNHNY